MLICSTFSGSRQRIACRNARRSYPCHFRTKLDWRCTAELLKSGAIAPDVVDILLKSTADLVASRESKESPPVQRPGQPAPAFALKRGPANGNPRFGLPEVALQGREPLGRHLLPRVSGARTANLDLRGRSRDARCGRSESKRGHRSSPNSRLQKNGSQ